jgi:glycosyltransferase involved in cell wall biosynthesis
MNEPKPFVSVIIPVLNDTENLIKCAKALKCQTYPYNCFEILIVDNGSDSPFYEITKMSDTIRLLHEAKRGSYAARNWGIRHSLGTVLAFLDSDCLPYPNWIENGVKALSVDSKIGVVGGRVELTYHHPKRLTLAETYEKYFAFDQKSYIQKLHFSITANLFTYKEIFNNVGLFRDDIYSGGDLEWGKRVYEAGYKLLFAEDVVIRHPARRTIRQLICKHRRIIEGQDKIGFYYKSPHQEKRGIKSTLIAESVKGAYKRLKNLPITELNERFRLFIITTIIAYVQRREWKKRRKKEIKIHIQN